MFLICHSMKIPPPNIQCLESIFSLCGAPNYLHSEKELQFLAHIFFDRKLPLVKTNPYHPQGNAQFERYNEIIWKTIPHVLKSENIPLFQWELVQPRALYAVNCNKCLVAWAHQVVVPHFFLNECTRCQPAVSASQCHTEGWCISSNIDYGSHKAWSVR